MSITIWLFLLTRTYVFLLNGQLDSNLVSNFLDDVQDSLLGCSDGLLIASDSDSSLLVLTSLSLNVNLSTSIVLDSIDGSTALTNDLSHSLAWDLEGSFLSGLGLESSSLKQLGLCSSYSLPATSDGDLVGVNIALLVLGVTRERELDAVFLLEADSVLATGTDKGRLNSSLDAENLGGFVLELFNLSKETLLGFLNRLFTADNLLLILAMACVDNTSTYTAINKNLFRTLFGFLLRGILKVYLDA